MQKYANLVDLEKCCQTHIFLQNNAELKKMLRQTHTLLQNFVLIQPTTSPPKVCKTFADFCQFCSPIEPFNFKVFVVDADAGRVRAVRPTGQIAAAAGGGSGEVPILFCQIFPGTMIGKISAVSAPIFASKYALCSIFQNLPDFQAEIFEIWQYFANLATFAKFLLNFHENC